MSILLKKMERSDTITLVTLVTLVHFSLFNLLNLFFKGEGDENRFDTC